ncbi:MAG: hypothetical protein ACR2OD_07455 [Gaiellaceae bacterium]
MSLLMLSFPAFAGASQLLTRDASDVNLQVNRAGDALITYAKPNGKVVRVLASGGVDARTPDAQGRQVRLKLDYSGGWKTRGKAVWKRFVDRCSAYDGPELVWLVTACKAPDGSYWALQAWQRSLPYHGGPASNRFHYTTELRLSHFTGELAQLEVFHDWMHPSRFHEVFGRVTYRGAPVHGFPKKRFPGADQAFARRVYADTFNSGYGSGWWRGDALRTHHPTGTFCVLFAKELTDKWGTNRGWGERYRIAIEGPGVTPDVVWVGAALPTFDPTNAAHVAHESAMEVVRRSLDPPDRRCKFS